MHGKLLRKFYFFAVIAVLPAVYCFFCSTSFQWGIVIRLAGGLILSLAVLLTAALPFSRKVRMFLGGVLGFCWMAGSLAEAVSFQHSGNTFDLKYLHHISLVTLLEGAAGVWFTAVAGFFCQSAGRLYLCDSGGRHSWRIPHFVRSPGKVAGSAAGGSVKVLQNQ